MPILITEKDITWSESDAKVDLTLPKKSIPTSNIDIMCTDRYLKVNYSPYFYECFLKNAVDEDKTVIVLEGGEINITLVKVNQGMWHELSDPSVALDRDKRRELKQMAMEYHEEKARKTVEERQKIKAEQNRWALRRAMDQDSNEKERIESVKQAERDRVTQELDAWQSLEDDVRQSRYLESIAKEKDGCSDEQKENVDSKLKENAIVEAPKPITKDERALKYEKIKHNLANPLGPKHSSGSGEKLKSEEKVKPLWEVNGPRQKAEISVSFTPRYFPSAARESLAREEEEWIEKNVKAQTQIKPKDEDTKEEERNPMWLKDKANAFYKSGNFPAAINAYSEAMSISPSLPSLYINRASCYIVMNLFEDCITDCTKALSLLNPPVEANRMSRVKALVKRGSAYCQLEEYQKALDDYKLAVKLHPDDALLEKDIELLQDKLP